MAYRYSAIHNTILHDGNDTDDAFDERGVLKYGKSLRVPMPMMDSMQRSIAADSGTVDDGDVKLISRQELADWDKAQLSAAWKGGLQDGDRVRIGDKNLVVSGRNPTNGKFVLRDASTSTTDAETRQAAYDSYDAEIQSRYLNNTYDAKAGESCLTAGREKGVWRERADGRLACVPGGDKSSKESEVAGPLGDSEQVQIKERMYADYDSEVSERWRR